MRERWPPLDEYYMPGCGHRQASQRRDFLLNRQSSNDPFYRREHRNEKWLSNLPKALKPECKIMTVGISVSSLLYLLPIDLCPQGKAGGTPSHCSSKPLLFSPFQVGVRAMSAQSNKSWLTFPLEIIIDSMQGKN